MSAPVQPDFVRLLTTGGERRSAVKSITLILLIIAMSTLLGACTMPGVGYYQRALDLGCTASEAGLRCPGGN